MPSRYGRIITGSYLGEREIICPTSSKGRKRWRWCMQWENVTLLQWANEIICMQWDNVTLLEWANEIMCQTKITFKCSVYNSFECILWSNDFYQQFCPIIPIYFRLFQSYKLLIFFESEEGNRLIIIALKKVMSSQHCFTQWSKINWKNYYYVPSAAKILLTLRM